MSWGDCEVEGHQVFDHVVHSVHSHLSSRPIIFDSAQMVGLCGWVRTKKDCLYDIPFVVLQGLSELGELFWSVVVGGEKYSVFGGVNELSARQKGYLAEFLEHLSGGSGQARDVIDELLGPSAIDLSESVGGVFLHLEIPPSVCHVGFAGPRKFPEDSIAGGPTEGMVFIA